MIAWLEIGRSWIMHIGRHPMVSQILTQLVANFWSHEDYVLMPHLHSPIYYSGEKD